MSTQTNLHNVKSVKAESATSSYTAGRTHWLEITDAGGNIVTLFIEAHEAEALADAWADTQVEPEPLTAEDVPSDETYRRHMIAAGRGHLLP